MVAILTHRIEVRNGRKNEENHIPNILGQGNPGFVDMTSHILSSVKIAAVICRRSSAIMLTGQQKFAG